MAAETCPVPAAFHPCSAREGEPGEGYPWHWSVYRWIEGENATVERIADPRQTAIDLARFITALHRIDTTGGPPPGPHNAYRGEPLEMRDTRTRHPVCHASAPVMSDHGKLAIS